MPDEEELAAIGRFLDLASETPRASRIGTHMGVDMRSLDDASAAEVRRLDLALMTQLTLS